jgi:hypothetical protein
MTTLSTSPSTFPKCQSAHLLPNLPKQLRQEETWRQTAYAKDYECREKDAEFEYHCKCMKTANDEAEWNAAMGRAAAEQEAALADEAAARAAKLEEELKAMKEKKARRKARRDARRGGRRDDRSRSCERADADTIPEADSSYLGTADDTSLNGLD